MVCSNVVLNDLLFIVLLWCFCTAFSQTLLFLKSAK